KVGTGELGASVDHHNDGRGLVERDAGLAIDLRRNQILFFRQNAARVHDAKLASSPLRVSVEPVASDPGFVADNGTPRAHDAIKEAGLAHVGASHDGNCWDAGGGSGESAGRIVSRLSQS